MRVAVVTVSDSAAAGQRDDVSGPLIVSWARAAGHDVVGQVCVPDRSEMIVAQLVQFASAGGADLILTTGGTGLGPRDITPEATRAVLEREAPGLAELLRHHGRTRTPMAALSRGVAGSRGATLIVNLPGAPAAVQDGLAALAPLVVHAVTLLAGDTEHQHE